MSTLRKGHRFLAEMGIEFLLLRTLDYVNTQVKNWIRSVSNTYWSIRGGTQTHSIRGFTAEFESRPSRGGSAIRWLINEEYDLLADLLEHLEPSDVFYDIGANVGLHSAFAGQICSTVIAFEPYEPNYEQLRRNLSGVQAKTTTINRALSNKNEDTSFEAPLGAVGYGTGGFGDGIHEVKSVIGDSFVSENEIDLPDIVKIDVEGAEGLVIEGLVDTLAHCRRVYLELHLSSRGRDSVWSYDWSPVDILLELSDMGFTIRILYTRKNELQIVGIREEQCSEYSVQEPFLD